MFSKQLKHCDNLFPLNMPFIFPRTFNLFFVYVIPTVFSSSPRGSEGWRQLGGMYRATTYEWNDKPCESEGKPLIIQIALWWLWVVRANVTSPQSGLSLYGPHSLSPCWNISLLTLHLSEADCLKVTRVEYWPDHNANNGGKQTRSNGRKDSESY